MTEFKFLKKMYKRLAEFEYFLAEEKKNDPKSKDLHNDSAYCAIECTIEEYLSLRYKS